MLRCASLNPEIVLNGATPDPAKATTSPRTIGFELHGGYCGGHGTPSCNKQHKITAAPFDFKMPN